MQNRQYLAYRYWSLHLSLKMTKQSIKFLFPQWWNAKHRATLADPLFASQVQPEYSHGDSLD
jgi:hypothetical protein